MRPRITFLTEHGMVLDRDENVILDVPGTPGYVNFPEETILKIHKLQPSFINRLVHTHPTGMFSLSGQDKAMLRRWAVTIHPFPIRLSTLTPDSEWDLTENIYVAKLEPKECWLERQKREGQSSFRKITIELEQTIIYYPGDKNCPKWVKDIYQKSFEREEYVG